MKTKDKTRVLCGLADGRVEIRRVSDLGLTSSFKIHNGEGGIWKICELEDGSFVSAEWKTMKRWDETGTVLQTFSGHSNEIRRLIELKSDVVVSGSNDKTLKMWKLSTGECLRTLSFHNGWVNGLEKMKDGVFVSGSTDRKIVVWFEKGNSIETYQSESWITAMTRLRDGSLVTASRSLMEIRQPYVLTITFNLYSDSIKQINNESDPQVCGGRWKEHNKRSARSSCGRGTRRVTQHVPLLSLAL